MGTWKRLAFPLCVGLGALMITPVTAVAAVQSSTSLECHSQGRDQGCAREYYVSINDREEDWREAYIVYYTAEGSNPRGQHNTLRDRNGADGDTAFRYTDAPVVKFKACEDVPLTLNDNCTGWYVV